MREQHVIHLLIRKRLDGRDLFFVYPRSGWLTPTGEEYLCLPTKRSVHEPLAPYVQGEPLDHFVDAILQEDLGLAADDYVLEQELPCVIEDMLSPVHQEATRYAVYPVDVWVEPARREHLVEGAGGTWMDCESALAHPRMSPTSRAVFALLQAKGAALLTRHPDAPTMDGLALRWFTRNRAGARHLDRETLDRILDAGDRAFNLRVADPYLRYQQQGLGFTWSFFTEKDRQDTHAHGAPVVEIYGVLEGRMEIRWKPLRSRDLGVEPPGARARGLDRGGLAPVPHRALAWCRQGRGVQGRPRPARGRGPPGREGENALR